MGIPTIKLIVINAIVERVATKIKVMNVSSLEYVIERLDKMLGNFFFKIYNRNIVV